MRHSLTVILAVTALLAGCSGITTDQVKKVQDEAVKVCSYLPTAETVQAILAASSPQVQGINAVAQAICSAVLAMYQGSQQITAQALVAQCPRVNGVCIQGTFVTEHPKGG